MYFQDSDSDSLLKRVKSHDSGIVHSLPKTTRERSSKMKMSALGEPEELKIPTPSTRLCICK